MSSTQLTRVLAGCAVALTAAACQPAAAHPSAGHVSPAAAPATFYALLSGRVMQESPAGLVQDFGPGDAYSAGAGAVWIARTRTACSAVITRHAGEATTTRFSTYGAVTALAVSPDGTQLAYARSGRAPIPASHGFPGSCGPESLVLRDTRTGHERVWPGQAGSISSLSWSSDNRHLAFQTGSCCLGGVTIHTLDSTAATTDVESLPVVTVPGVDAATTNLHDPAYAGRRLLLLADDIGREATSYRVITTENRTVAELQDEGVGLDADPAGDHLLVSLYGDPTDNGSLLAFSGGAFRVLGRGFADATW